MGRGMGGGAPRGGGSPDRRASPSDYYRGSGPPPSQAVLTPHGGQYLNTDSNVFEMVFMPLQARIYVYDKALQPLSAQDVHAQMSVQIPGQRDLSRIPFQYLAVPSATGQQDYVVAVFDVSQLHDKETPITLQLSNVSDPRHPAATFTPVWSPAKVRPYVARVLPRKADVDAVMRQRTCPVCGDPLGSKNKGPVVKLLIGEDVLYVCGEDCTAAVSESPEKYLPRPQPPVTGR